MVRILLLDAFRGQRNDVDIRGQLPIYLTKENGDA
jgi:hypothetical protein